MDAQDAQLKTTVYVGVSVDGYIARRDHTLDFLDFEPPTSDMGFTDFMASVDVLIMGRSTYDFVTNSGFDWPYGTTQVVVLTHRDLPIPVGQQATVSASAQAPRELLASLAAVGRRHAYIDGGSVVQQFLAAGLVDQLILTTVPVLIGEGISLFGPLPHDLRLSHISTEPFENGMVQTTYGVVNPV